MTNIHHINLAGIDLNLLVVFDALMTEQNVTRAGERVGLSQPATSNALARLRSLAKDGLFTRTAAGLRPTPTAIALHQQLRPALQQIQVVLLDQSTFDPATSDRVFAIGMSDYVEFTLLPHLMQAIQTLAPQISVQIRSGDRQKLLSLLDNGEIDLACGVFPEKIAWHQEQLLLQESYVCVCRKNHPIIGSSLSLEEYLSVSHLLVSVKQDRIGRVDTLLAEQNLKRHIALSTPHFLTAPFILAQTDLVATLAYRVALAFVNNQQLKLLPLPFAISNFSVFMRWHQSTETSPACQWLRSLALSIALKVDKTISGTI
ncbi:LysR family transcriptional regulator [Leptolyngbya sp. CCY15150]|uniref:LysR family transcriptional regulator n=1 Tax=Leptolyngbya sp. CCY15150 TaxID=2767772 RepID=UPI0019519B4C|nr:LysR family transcriptional regulator [Leptolyngbya sp. CCY15150]